MKLLPRILADEDELDRQAEARPVRAGEPGGSQARLPLVAGWLLGMGLYFKFLLDQTGNSIYPLYWNFQFVGLGAGAPGRLPHRISSSAGFRSAQP